MQVAPPGLGEPPSWRFWWDSSHMGAAVPAPRGQDVSRVPSEGRCLRLPSCELYSSAVLWDLTRTG